MFSVAVAILSKPTVKIDTNYFFFYNEKLDLKQLESLQVEFENICIYIFGV